MHAKVIPLHVETDAAENLFDALPGPHDRVQATRIGAAARQGDIDGFGGEALIQQRVGQRLAPSRQRGFNLLLDEVDPCAFGLARFGIEFAKALQQFSQHARLAEKACFLVFEGGDVGGFCEGFLRVRDNLVQVH